MAHDLPELPFELLEHAASKLAPSGGAVLWGHRGVLRLVRHGGEPFDVSYASALVTVPRTKTTGEMPKGISAVYSPGFVERDRALSVKDCDDAVLRAMRTDAIDADLLQTRTTKTKKGKSNGKEKTRPQEEARPERPPSGPEAEGQGETEGEEGRP